MEVVKSVHLLILKVLLVIQVALLAGWFFNATSDGKYFLFRDDEVINYTSAKLYAQTGVLRAGSCINEDVSAIGEFNWYGPGYQFIYGSAVKLFGDHSTLFIQLHFTFALMTLLLIYFFPGEILGKLFFANALAFSWQFTAYVFTYFPESLNLLLTVVLLLVLLKIHSTEVNRDRQRLMVLYIVLVLLFMLCRVTFIFWLSGLIGFATSRRQAIYLTAIFATGLLFALIYMKIFTAPPYAGDMQKIDRLYKFDLPGFILKTAKSLLVHSWNLIMSGSIPVYFLLSLGALNLYLFWKSHTRIYLASVIISVLTLAALLAYYTPDPWYFIRQSDGLIPLLLVPVLMDGTSRLIKYCILAGSLITFVISWTWISETVTKRREAYANWIEFSPMKNAFAEIPQYMEGSDNINVLWCYNEYPFGSTTESLLPFSTRANAPILYSTNVVSADESAEVRFKRYNKLRMDYILSRMAVNLPGCQEVHATDFYHLYKIIDNKK